MHRALSLALLVVTLSSSSVAEAYCISMTCTGESDQSCDGDPVPDGCALLRWKTACVGFSVQRDGYSKLDASQIDTLARAAFSTWASLDCGGGVGPGFIVQDLGTVTCANVEYNSSAGNANVIMIREKAWTHPPTAGHNIALTTTTYDPDTGELLDADMEINAAEFDLTTSDTMVDYDLASVLTHETGHFMGLAHSTDPTATMRPSYEPGNLELRHPVADDLTAICSLYPPNPALDKTCNPLPRHGFSPECKDQQTEGKCAASPVSSGDEPYVSVALVGFAAVLLRRRLRARSGSRLRS